MGETKKSSISYNSRFSDKTLVPKLAAIIEQTLDSFGIIVRIAEVNNRPKDIEFCLDVALGTSLESITKLHKDLGMALASYTGDVEIEAPIPGRSLIAIRLPYKKGWDPRGSIETGRFLSGEMLDRVNRNLVKSAYYAMYKYLSKIANGIDSLAQIFMKYSN